MLERGVRVGVEERLAVGQPVFEAAGVDEVVGHFEHVAGRAVAQRGVLAAELDEAPEPRDVALERRARGVAGGSAQSASTSRSADTTVLRWASRMPSRRRGFSPPDRQQLVAVDDPDRAEDPEFHGCQSAAPALQGAGAADRPAPRKPARRTLDSPAPGQNRQRRTSCRSFRSSSSKVCSTTTRSRRWSPVSPRPWSTSRARPCAPSPGSILEEVASGEWGIGGKALSTQDVKDLQASGK